MNLKIVNWNIWGGNDSSKRKIIKALLRAQRHDIFCLQETKTQVMSSGIVRSLGPSRFLDWEVLDATGTARGVLVVWDIRSFVLLDKEVGMFTVSCLFRNVNDGFV